MLDFIQLQFQMKNITAQQVQQYADKGWITKGQAAEITGK